MDREGLWRNWVLLPTQLNIHGKELYIVAIEADGCLLAVWVERRMVRGEEVEWREIDEEGRSLSE